MIETVDIIDAINIILVSEYPEVVVYRDVCPVDFKRPCFFIQSLENKIKQASLYTEEVNRSLNIQCVDEVDEYYESSTDRLVSKMDKIASKLGRINVKDRVLTAFEILTSRQLDIADIRINLHYFDDSIKKPSIDEKIEDIQIKMEG